MSSPGSPTFFLRWAALPFSPRLWRESADHELVWILVPLCLWALAAGAVGGIHTASEVHGYLYGAATFYEQNADPLLLDGGRFSLTGDRILRIVDADGRTGILIDPEETVADAEVTAAQSIVVRADRIAVKQPGRSREIAAAEVAKILGEHVLFDADWLRRAADRLLYVSLIALPVLSAIGDVILCGLSALAVGLLLLLLRGQWLGVGYRGCATIALATGAFTIVADLALRLLGVELPIPGYVLWPLVMTALGFAALASRRTEDSAPV